MSFSCDTNTLLNKVVPSLSLVCNRLTNAASIVSGLPVLEGCEGIAKIPSLINDVKASVNGIKGKVESNALEAQNAENNNMGLIDRLFNWLSGGEQNKEEEKTDDEKAIDKKVDDEKPEGKKSDNKKPEDKNIDGENPDDKESDGQKLEDYAKEYGVDTTGKTPEEISEAIAIEILAKEFEVDTKGKTKEELIIEIAKKAGIELVIHENGWSLKDIDRKKYDQTDYGNIKLGRNDESTVQGGGCEPTAYSLLASLAMGFEITPDVLLSEYIPEIHNYYKKGDGTGQEVVYKEEYNDRVNLKFEDKYAWGEAWGEGKLMEALENGYLVLWRTKDKNFTSGGHWLAMPGLTEDGNIIIHDPNGANWTKAHLKDGFENGFDPKWMSHRKGEYYIFSIKDPSVIEKNTEKTGDELLAEIMDKVSGTEAGNLIGEVSGVADNVNSSIVEGLGTDGARSEKFKQNSSNNSSTSTKNQSNKGSSNTTSGETINFAEIFNNILNYNTYGTMGNDTKTEVNEETLEKAREELKYINVNEIVNNALNYNTYGTIEDTTKKDGLIDKEENGSSNKINPSKVKDLGTDEARKESIKLKKQDSKEKQEANTENKNNKEGVFGKDITYESGYEKPDDVMPYTYLKPSSANDGTKKPLIVWLHGGSSNGLKTYSESNYNLAHIIETSNLTNFDAYVLSPVLTKHDDSNSWWCNEKVAKNVADLIDKFATENNIDRNNIIIMGGSEGGRGVQYMADVMPEYFSQAVVLSGYPVYGVNNSETKVPMKGYVGGWDDSKSKGYMEVRLAGEIGKENVTTIEEATHGKLPKILYNIDKDGDGKSDFIEDLFPTESSNKTTNNSSSTVTKVEMNDSDIIEGLGTDAARDEKFRQNNTSTNASTVTKVEINDSLKNNNSFSDSIKENGTISQMMTNKHVVELLANKYDVNVAGKTAEDILNEIAIKNPELKKDLNEIKNSIDSNIKFEGETKTSESTQVEINDSDIIEGLGTDAARDEKIKNKKNSEIIKGLGTNEARKEHINIKQNNKANPSTNTKKPSTNADSNNNTSTITKEEIENVKEEILNNMKNPMASGKYDDVLLHKPLGDSSTLTKVEIDKDSAIVEGLGTYAARDEHIKIKNNNKSDSSTTTNVELPDESTPSVEDKTPSDSNPLLDNTNEKPSEAKPESEDKNKTPSGNKPSSGGSGNKPSRPSLGVPGPTQSPIVEGTPEAIIEAAKNNNEITSHSEYICEILEEAGYLSEEQMNLYKDYNMEEICKKFEEFGWEKITSKDKLQAGDIIIINNSEGNTAQIYAGDNKWYTIGNRETQQMKQNWTENAEWWAYRPTKR